MRVKDVKDQGGHKPGKRGKPGKLREFEKLSESQGNVNFCRKAWSSQRKCKICVIMAYGNKCISANFFLLDGSGKYLKMPWKSQGKLREFRF